MKEEIIWKLKKEGYNQRETEEFLEDIKFMDDELRKMFYLWVTDDVQTDYEFNGISVTWLMSYRKMSYPAALMAIDWAIKEPTIACKELTQVYAR